MSRGRHRPHYFSCLALHAVIPGKRSIKRWILLGLKQRGRSRGLGDPSQTLALGLLLKRRGVERDHQNLAGDEGGLPWF